MIFPPLNQEVKESSSDEKPKRKLPDPEKFSKKAGAAVGGTSSLTSQAGTSNSSSENTAVGGGNGAGGKGGDGSCTPRGSPTGSMPPIQPQNPTGR